MSSFVRYNSWLMTGQIGLWRDDYRRALAGGIKNFTGVNAPYEPPENPELRLKAGERGADVLAQEVVEDLVRRGIV
jgi:adenylylsulfate kinase-like enzyme